MTEEKWHADFIAKIMKAIEETGYPNPGYYVEECGVEPVIHDKNGKPRQSIYASSPTGALVDLANVIREDR